MTTLTPANWYEDPNDPTLWRFWDGQQWTDRTAPRDPAAASVAPQPQLSQPAQLQPTQPQAFHPLPQPQQQSQPQQGTTEAAPQADAQGFEQPNPNVGGPSPVSTGFTQPQQPTQRYPEPPQAGRSGLLASKKGLEAENAQLRAMVDNFGFAERNALAEDIARLQGQRQQIAVALQAEQTNLDLTRRQLAVARDDLVLQEVGIYDYHHPLEDSVQYASAVKNLRDQIKTMSRANGGAVTATTNWQINGSVKEGSRMVREFSKLLLRAYNNEADGLVSSLKPYKLATSVDRLQKSRDTISKLGQSMSISITPAYHELRIEELRLTADYQEMKAEEKEREREERVRMREEAQAQKEIAAERARLDKERLHYIQALNQLRETGSPEEIANAEGVLSEIEESLAGVEERAANIRAGYVYVISNVGAFGPGVVKIGMTRRLDPMDRVRELGDASVPFGYDVHATIFSQDAVGLETALHQHFTDRRVNRVNLRREFFYASPSEVRTALAQMDGSLLEFVEDPIAEQWHQSENERKRLGIRVPTAVEQQSPPLPNASVHVPMLSQ